MYLSNTQKSLLDEICPEILLRNIAPSHNIKSLAELALLKSDFTSSNIFRNTSNTLNKSPYIDRILQISWWMLFISRISLNFQTLYLTKLSESLKIFNLYFSKTYVSAISLSQPCWTKDISLYHTYGVSSKIIWGFEENQKVQQ